MRFILTLLDQSPWLLIAALPVVAAFVWQRFRGGRLHLSLRGSSRLYQRFRNKPLGDQLAANAALGIVIDDRVLEMATKRHNPLGFLRTYKQGRQHLRCVGPDQLVYVGKGDCPNLLLRGAILFYSTLAVFSAGSFVALVGAELFGLLPLIQVTAAAIACLALGFLPLNGSISVSMSAAHRLLKEMDMWFPPREPTPIRKASPDPPTTAVTSKHRRSPRKPQMQARLNAHVPPPAPGMHRASQSLDQSSLIKSLIQVDQ